MADIFNLTDTWNNGGTVFNSIMIDTANTASAAGSMLLNLKESSTSQFTVDPTGVVTSLGAVNGASPTEMGYLSGVTSAIQTQLNAKGVGDALTANPLSQFAATTSAQLASVLSDETGSGAAVFATSPTLVTPALGTPSSGVLTNCTFPTLNQNTTGTAAGLSATLAVASGGTGLTAVGSALQVLRTNAGATALEWATPSGGAFVADGFTRITPGTPILLNQGTGNETALTLNYTVNKATSGNDTGLLINMTDTASPGTSLPLDVQVGGGSLFSVNHLGYATVQRLYWPNGQYSYTDGGALYLRLNSTSFSLQSCSSLHLSTNTSPGVYIASDGNNFLAQRNGTAAQAFRVYNTYTDASNYERMGFRWNANVAEVSVAVAGTGTQRGLKIGTATTHPISLYGVTPVTQAAAIASPTGGATVDTECRAALSSLLTAVRNLGAIAT